MDFEESEEASDTCDSQAVLTVEFNNQATLKNEDNNESQNSSKHLELENSWIEENQPSELLSTLLDPSSPLAPSNSLMLTENEPETTYSDDFEALFSISAVHTDSDNFGDQIDIKAEAGVCGLKNLGNTCFMSTGVQCLMATPALVQCLLHQPLPAPTKDSLTLHLSQLTHKMWSGHYSAIQPTDFKETLGVHYPQFKDFRQHDCQEFLALLLDGLHEQLNTSGKQKAQELLEMDCAESQSKESVIHHHRTLNTVITPSHNNFKEINSCSKHNLSDKNESMSFSPKIEKIINNCKVEDSKTIDQSPKLPLIVNKCNNSDATCDALNGIDHIMFHNLGKGSPTINILNNCPTKLSGFEDIIKDAKTSNVNVLVTKQEANNEIRFDSEKFPKNENVRRKETFNNNSFHLYKNNVTNGKRGKTTVTHYQNAVDFREGLDLKRIKIQINEQTEEEHEVDLPIDCDKEKNHRMEDERKNRASTKNLEKNYRMECERQHKDVPGPSSAICAAEIANAEEDLDAEIQWQKHLASHKSVIVDSFQGQFKSTVVCSKCNHISVTYEPFMYLSVPLPHAMERQLCITFVSAKEIEPVQYLLTVSKKDSVSVIREQLMQLIGRPVSLMVLAEVLDCHIAKILDDRLLVRYINCSARSLYCFETTSFSQFSELETTSLSDNINSSESADKSCSARCTICLDEQEMNMSRHDCSFVLCDSCIVRTNQHFGGQHSFECPVCHKKLIPEIDLVRIGPKPDTEPIIRMLNISLVFRLDTVGDGSNNTRTIQLFGHPQLLRLPNRLEGQQLHEAVATLVPYSQQYKILLVDGQGHHCSRCMFNSHCRGCPIESEGTVVLTTGDSLAALFMEPVTEICSALHSTMLQLSVNKPLSLYDCIQAFSQSEMLDENNPWYCPSCKKNQCASKTLSVWRYPKYLIIYLKRFVFEDCVSTKLDDKVIFPLNNLILSASRSPYDLYACVCHVGGVSAGHYTAYTQHPRTGEWHHYNDDYVTKQPPQEDDYSNAYILFYMKRGADMKNEDFNAKLVTNIGSFC